MTGNSAVAVGRVLGDYELLELIGEGGSCQVFRGRHRGTGQVVAVKILPERTASNPVLMRRFEQEFCAARRCDHPNIVRALDFDGGPRTPFLVMEHVDGESLGTRLERDGPMPEEEALRVIVAVCRGLLYAHSLGMIHRDVKPDNVLLARSGDIKITDLGLVKELLLDQDLTRTGRGLGTPHYMAPEQFRNAKAADVRADVYSVGATLYSAVTGRLPFGGSSPLEAWKRKMAVRLEPPRALVPTLSPRTDLLIRRCLEAEPDRRPSSCEEIVRELTGEEPSGPSGGRARPQRIWYLVYQDRQDQEHTLRQPLEKLRQYLRAGRFANAREVRASRSPSGPFSLLSDLPEFRDVAPPPAAVKGQETVMEMRRTKVAVRGRGTQVAPASGAAEPGSAAGAGPGNAPGWRGRASQAFLALSPLARLAATRSPVACWLTLVLAAVVTGLIVGRLLIR